MEVVTKEEFSLYKQSLQIELDEIKEKLAILDCLTEQWVDTKTAFRITGIKSHGTLAKEASKPNAIIKVSYVNGHRKVYELKSLIEYRKQRRGIQRIDVGEIHRALLDKK